MDERYAVEAEGEGEHDDQGDGKVCESNDEVDTVIF